MSAAQGSGNVSPNGERLDAPAVKVVVADPSGRKVEVVKAEGIELEVCQKSPDAILIIAEGRVPLPVRRESLQRLLPALTLYAHTGSMVAAEGASERERHDGCNGGAV